MSSLRARQQKRKIERAPGVWYQRTWSIRRERPLTEHGVQNRWGIGVNPRVFSGGIVVSLALMLVLFFVTDYFYVRSITVVGANYLDDAQVFRYSGIAEMHIFWVNPETVRQNLLNASVEIADARVVVGWPPNMVRIYLDEREPAIVWTQGDISSLVDLQGRRLRFLAQGETHPKLLWVVADYVPSGLPGLDQPVPVAAVNGALQLQTLLAGVQQLRYHPINGLGFTEPGGWDVWLGVGTDMVEKLLVYEKLRDNLLARGIMPTEINVAHLEAVYYCGSVGPCHE